MEVSRLFSKVPNIFRPSRRALISSVKEQIKNGTGTLIPAPTPEELANATLKVTVSKSVGPKIFGMRGGSTVTGYVLAGDNVVAHTVKSGGAAQFFADYWDSYGKGPMFE